MQPIHCMRLRSAKINAMCGDNCDSAKIPAINVSKLLMLHTGAVVPHSTNFAAGVKKYTTARPLTCAQCAHFLIGIALSPVRSLPYPVYLPPVSNLLPSTLVTVAIPCCCDHQSIRSRTSVCTCQVARWSPGYTSQ